MKITYRLESEFEVEEEQKCLLSFDSDHNEYYFGLKEKFEDDDFRKYASFGMSALQFSEFLSNLLKFQKEAERCYDNSTLANPERGNTD